MDLICCPIGGLVCGLWRKSLIWDHDLWFPADVRYEDNYWGPIAKLYVQRAAFVPRIGYLYRQWRLPPPTSATSPTLWTG